MCGISAMLGNPDLGIVKNMTHMQAHRGPDGNATWIGEQCSLGHSRLSIVDLLGSNQPLFSEDGCVLVHNGEIYNHISIRDKLSHYLWNTKGDSETILALHSESKDRLNCEFLKSSEVKRNQFFRYKNGYSKAGNPASRHVSWVKKLDGIWSFALWDPISQELILSRDRLGVKPLSRTIVNDSLLVASESKAFRAHEGYISELDINSLIARLAYEYPLDNTTLFRNVIQVTPGSIETWKLDENGSPVLTGLALLPRTMICESNEWNPNKEAHLLLDSLKSGVSDRLMSDVPLGIVLSGGLDSSLIVALSKDSAEERGLPVPECWTVAEDENNSDWLAAESVVSKLEVTHHKKILEPDLFWKYLPKLSWSGEDLDVTVAFFQPLFENMSQRVKVGLCGQGADELHAGYSRYSDIKKHRLLIESRLKSCENDFAQTLLNFTDSGYEYGLGKGLPWNNSTHDPNSNFSSLKNTLDFEINNGQLSNFQLRLVDRHSMSNGLEVRVPFLGIKHVDLSSKLPMNWKLSENAIRGMEKAALREAAKLTNLPSSIINRPKLPAGRSTSPSLLETFIKELKPRINEIVFKNQPFGKILEKQQDIAIGLALFESIHTIDNGIGRENKGVVELIDDYLSKS